ncbi:MAG: DUF885 domain-containing protein [Gammaproteobacteria bacterium]|nr:DUF885 domain-containing protein [Gammaproteobacteria bacterium]
MKKGSLKRPILGTLAVLLIIAGVWLAKLIWFKPFNIDHFYNRIFIEFAIDSPEMLSQMRMLPGWADWYADDLDSRDPARAQEGIEMMRDALETLRSYDIEDQTESQKLSTRILEWFIENNLRGEEFVYHNYPVNQLFGVQSNLPTFMVETHQINDEEGAEDYIARLNQFGRVFDEVREGLVLREEKGILPPTFVVDRVINEVEGFVGDESSANILYTNMEDKLAELAELDDARKANLLAQTEDAVANVVYPAYEGLLGYLKDVKSKTTSEDGVWKLPNGDAFYRQQLRTHTTTDLDPVAVHDIGLREVDNIQAEMDAILVSEGYTEGTVGERMLALSKEDRFLYPDTDEGREQILEDYQKIIDEISAGMDSAFNLRPEAGVEVKRIPEFKEKTSPGAYYNSPARDGSRPGIFYANLRSVTEIPKYGMRTLAYHEAIPGHHFQIALQGEMEGLPIFRTFPLFTAYTEGWALYSEQVAAEMGFQENPYDRLGYLQAALFRAVRLVVDTGIHAKKWTREEAIEYMTNNTGMPQSDVVAEIERYIVMPGQACAYMIGKLKILELRERAREALGDDFEITEFHRVVLENGAVPLSILEEQVDKWIAASL